MPGSIRSMHLEHMLRDVQTDRGSLLHGRLLGWQFDTVTLARRCRRGASTPSPMRLYDRGEPVDATFEIIERNVRVPRQVLGDVRAQLAACAAGEKGLLDLIGRYGAERFRSGADGLLDQAERLARNAIRAMADGTYAFEDWIDDDGIDSGAIPIRVTFTVTGDKLTADFTGTAPQVKGAINSPLPFTKSAVYACVRHLIGGDPPNNEGYFRPIEVIAPAGTIVNPVMPAPVAARGLTGFRLRNGR